VVIFGQHVLPDSMFWRDDRCPAGRHGGPSSRPRGWQGEGRRERAPVPRRGLTWTCESRRKCRSHFLRSVLALAGLYGWSARGLGCGDRVWAGQGCSGKGGSQAALAGDDPDGKRARGYLGEKLLDDGMVAAVFLGLEPS